jgi:hypothetical protein
MTKCKTRLQQGKTNSALLLFFVGGLNSNLVIIIRQLQFYIRELIHLNLSRLNDVQEIWWLVFLIYHFKHFWACDWHILDKLMQHVIRQTLKKWEVLETYNLFSLNLYPISLEYILEDFFIQGHEMSIFHANYCCGSFIKNSQNYRFWFVMRAISPKPSPELRTFTIL